MAQEDVLDEMINEHDEVIEADGKWWIADGEDRKAGPFDTNAAAWAWLEQQSEQAPSPDEDDESFDDRVQRFGIERGYFDGPIPDDIPAVHGLPPKRSELARFLEWRRRTAAELEHAKVSHGRAITALGGEATTKQKIDAAIKGDVKAVLDFALGGDVITDVRLRAFERAQLEKKLADDKHAAEIARESLNQIEFEIAVLTIGLRFLDARADRFTKSALIEAAEELEIGNRYLDQLADLEKTWQQLVGLGFVVGHHEEFRALMEGVEIHFQSFLPSLRGEDLKFVSNRTAVGPWQRLANELLKNPQVDVAAMFPNDGGD